MIESKIDNSLHGKEFVKMAFDRCIKCSTCKMGFKNFEPSCPSGEKFLFESYWASGRIRTLRGVVLGELELNDQLKHSIFACTTCGACMDSCQAPQADYIVDIIEALRELAVKNIGPAKNQEHLVSRVQEVHNPYGEPNSDNSELKAKYRLPDKAEWVYYIGCTSNYRQQDLRDSTLDFLKKANIDFTLIDEHCCTSPLIRTGQIDNVKDVMSYNIEQIKKTGAKKVITSCAGCYRTLIKDFKKFSMEYDFKVYHTSELIKQLFDSQKIKIKSEFKETITYHDPCHLGRHMNMYEIPREIFKHIPGINFVEMRRNRNHAWCCGAGGGVKIAYPEWAIEISKERLEEAKETNASIVSSTCPFCKTNLSDSNEKNEMGFKILDIVELLSLLDYEITEDEFKKK